MWGLNAPKADLGATKKLCLAVNQGLQKGLLASVCVAGRGGLAYGLARMAMAGGLGLNVDLDGLAAEDGLSALQKLYSESCGRFIVTVDPSRSAELRALLGDIPAACIGLVAKGKDLVINSGGKEMLRLGANRMIKSIHAAFRGSGMSVRALVLTGFGLNCDFETAHVLRLAGAEAHRVHISDLTGAPGNRPQPAS